jgi:pyrroloquinoline quinone (PQQ) biosynthesis protein C
MSHTESLHLLTQADREALHSVPVIRRALAGGVTRELYVAFLTQAYHHVRHTVPLLMAVGARLTPRHHWLQEQLVHYIEEEVGHEEWVLNDIAAAGGDAERVRQGAPAIETDAMVAYAYDTVMRRSPVGFFGMVHVLEGTSVALALTAAKSIQSTLRLPDRAFTYLNSHGQLDQQHVGHLASVLERLDSEQDMPAVITCARAMYWLYGNLFRGLERDAASLAYDRPSDARKRA